MSTARTEREREGRQRIQALYIPGTISFVPEIDGNDLAQLECIEMGEGVREIHTSAFCGA